MHTGIHSEGLKPTPRSVFLLESGHIFSTLHLGVHFFFIHCVCSHGCSHGGQRAPGLGTQVPRLALQTSVPKSDYCPPLSSTRHVGDLQYTQLVSGVYLMWAEL